MRNNKDLKNAYEELERLQNLSLDMFSDKYLKKANDNHKRIQKLKKLIRRLEEC